MAKEKGFENMEQRHAPGDTHNSPVVTDEAEKVSGETNHQPHSCSFPVACWPSARFYTNISKNTDGHSFHESQPGTSLDVIMSLLYLWNIF